METETLVGEPRNTKAEEKRLELIEKIEELKKIKARLTAEKGLEDLYYFSKYLVETDEERRKNIVDHVHGEWWEWYKSSTKRLKMILVPRGTLKSTIFTVNDTMRHIIKDRNERILIANSIVANAQRFLGEVKHHFRHNQQLIDAYGEFYAPELKWNESEIEVTGRSPGVREPSVSAVGVEGTLVSQHYSRIIWDDLVGETNIGTREQSLKVIDWWKRTLSLLDPQGEGLIIGTRWADFELYRYIIDELGDEVDIFIRGAYKEDGSLYYPEVLSQEELDRLKAIQRSYIFSCFYLNDPTDSEDSLVKRENIHYYGDFCECGSVHRLPEKGSLAIFIGCDPAYGTDTTADESAIAVVGVDVNDDWYVLESVGGRWGISMLMEKLFDLNQIYSPHSITLETVGVGRSVLDPIHREEERRHVYLPIKEIAGRGKVEKEKRIRSVLPHRFERNKVFIRKDMVELEDQLTRFPRSKHDDYLDALADVTEVAFSPEEPLEERPQSDSKLQQAIWDRLSEDDDNSYFDEVLGSIV